MLQIMIYLSMCIIFWFIMSEIKIFDDDDEDEEEDAEAEEEEMTEQEQVGIWLFLCFHVFFGVAGSTSIWGVSICAPEFGTWQILRPARVVHSILCACCAVSHQSCLVAHLMVICMRELGR